MKKKPASKKGKLLNHPSTSTSLTVKTSKKILNFEGQPMTLPNGTIATFGIIAAEALLSSPVEADDIQGERAYGDFKLARLLTYEKELGLSTDSIEKIKRAVSASRSLNKIVIGRMFEILEGNTDNGDLEA